MLRRRTTPTHMHSRWLMQDNMRCNMQALAPDRPSLGQVQQPLLHQCHAMRPALRQHRPRPHVQTQQTSCFATQRLRQPLCLFNWQVCSAREMGPALRSLHLAAKVQLFLGRISHPLELKIIHSQHLQQVAAGQPSCGRSAILVLQVVYPMTIVRFPDFTRSCSSWKVAVQLQASPLLRVCVRARHHSKDLQAKVVKRHQVGELSVDPRPNRVLQAALAAPV